MPHRFCALPLARFRLALPIALLSTVFSISGCSTVSQTPPVNDSGSGPGSNSGLDRAPIPISRVNPAYPRELLAKGFSGTVVVDFIVDTHGVVRRAFAYSSSYSGFEAPAVAAVSKWHFEPAKKGGKAVNAHMQVPIYFQVKPGHGSVDATPNRLPAAGSFIVDGNGQAHNVEASKISTAPTASP